MKTEYLKKLNNAFKDFKFFENGHYYEYKGKPVGISVTRLIEQYTSEFDSEKIAEMVAIKQNKTVEQVLEEWKLKNEFACAKGHTCHEFAQCLWSHDLWQRETFDNSLEFKMAVDTINEQAYRFMNDYQDRLEHLAVEFVIGSEEYDIASAIDHLFISKKDGSLILVDYKTNSNIHKNEEYAKNMKVPLSHLKDTTLNHYAIQLSIYRFLVEKYTDIKVSGMVLVWFSECNKNYEIIKVPYLKEEVQRILENRRGHIMGKCIPVLIIGKSGSGKSTSLRNLNKENYSLVNVLNKDLPFKNGRNIKALCTKDYEQVKNFIKQTPKDIVVIDDFGYIMTDKFVKKATETGYTKFSVIAQEFYNFVEFIKSLDGDKRVYLMMHEEKSDNGDITPKTCGKMLDNQICVEGLFSILLRCIYDGKQHKFKTTTDGLDVCKTPIDMFQTEYIDNDLKLVDDRICEFYEIKKEEENK